MTDLILKLIRVGLILSTAGILVKATLFFKDQAIQAHEQGVVSLTWLNKKLQHGK